MAELQIHQCLEYSICWVIFLGGKAFYSLPPQLPDFFFYFLPKLFSPFSFSDWSSDSSVPGCLSCLPSLTRCPRPFPLRASSIFPSLCFLLFPCRLLPRVAYQTPQCHDYKGSEKNSSPPPTPHYAESRRDQVTKRGCEPALPVWL